MAKSGSNPFHDPSTEQHQSGTYELYVTASGKEGTYRLLPNTTAYHGFPPLLPKTHQTSKNPFV